MPTKRRKRTPDHNFAIGLHHDSTHNATGSARANAERSIRRAVGIQPHQCPGLPGGEAVGAAHQNLAVGLDGQAADLAQNPGREGREGGVEGAVGIQAGEGQRRRAVVGSEAAGNQNPAIGLQRHGPNKAIGPNAARIKRRVGSAVGVEALNFAGQHPIHKVETAGGYDFAIGLHRQALHAVLQATHVAVFQYRGLKSGV